MGVLSGYQQAGINKMLSSIVNINFNNKLEVGKVAPTNVKIELLDESGAVLGKPLFKDLVKSSTLSTPFTEFNSTLNTKNGKGVNLKFTFFAMGYVSEVVNVPFSNYTVSSTGDSITYNVDYKGLNKITSNKSAETNTNTNTNNQKAPADNKKKWMYMGLGVLAIGVIYYYMKNKK